MEPESPTANRILAFYLLVVALLQAALYREVIIRGPEGWALYNLEPRLGLFLLDAMLWPGKPFPGPLSWASVLALTAMAALLLMDVAGLRAYLVFEVVLALPTAYLFLATLVLGAAPGAGFSRLDLALPAIPFLMTSVLPVLFAWQVRQRLKEEDA